MSVYVDDMRAPFGRMRMCHMTADTHGELVEMADRIGVARKWIQHAGNPVYEHFDIALSKRSLAVRAGAVEVSYPGGLAEVLARKKANAATYFGEGAPS